MSEITIGIPGAAGRMGRMLIQAVGDRLGLALVSAWEASGSPFLGADAGELAGVGRLDVPIEGDAQTGFAAAEVVIDFSVVAAVMAHLELARPAGTAMVIGVTGFSPEQRGVIEQAAREIPIVMAPNFSVGVNLMFKISAEVARVLGDDYDIEIIEAHHRHKVDAPSGTAVGLGEAIAEAVGRNLSEVAIFGREGHTGARDSRTIGFSTIRAGDVVGEHTAMFAGDGERLEITHRASSRMTFARGAARAAEWVANREPGLYDMRDILGFR